MALHTYGLNAVDWEPRVDFDRLRAERLGRAKACSRSRSWARLLCFDPANIRYITATHIGTWSMDKLIRFCAAAAGRRPDRLGLRVGGAPPPDLLPVAGRGRPRPASRR